MKEPTVLIKNISFNNYFKAYCNFLKRHMIKAPFDGADIIQGDQTYDRKSLIFKI